ncbi:hypothetical protein ZIOFF_043371 [Zingiber officinale]|uniref:Uncharacterized protein n=1 Tax=Zingiber officinale TaxID=94328 RepID=A0A8J5FT58_ZINOF|nr:hypothetical protein ZIOFF_043371 [Zingiber officinale]
MILQHLLRVVPVIGILSDKQSFKSKPNASEVETVFDAPLEMFLKDENRRSEEREWMGEKYLIHYFNFETENKQFVIWGLTAGILIHAASVVYDRTPSFLEQRPRKLICASVSLCKFRLIVVGKELWGYIDGSDSAPTMHSKLAHWEVKDVRVMTWILGSVDELLVPNLRPYKIAKGM